MKHMLAVTIFSMTVIVLSTFAYAENIDPQGTDMQFAWGENIGWANFQPDLGEGVQVSSSGVAGFVWAENIGWINLSPSTYGGVLNDGAGNLSGFAWGENVGWINFDPQVAGDSSDYGVKIDLDGSFSGWAWGENIGWINFGITDNYVVACKVGESHLATFVTQWLEQGSTTANLDGAGLVDIADFSIFASYWLDFCPNNWPITTD